jgi:hypothetical protein
MDSLALKVVSGGAKSGLVATITELVAGWNSLTQ